MAGHIYRRVLRGTNRHRWYAVVDVAPVGQPRKQLTRAFDTRREAQAWADQTAARRRARTGGPTVGEYLTEWLAGRVALRPSTLASYRAHIERHLIPQLGDLPLEEVSPQHVEQLHARLLAGGVTPATLARVHATLSTALTTARARGQLSHDPLAGVQLPRVERPEPTVWTLAQAQVFLAHVRGEPHEALWRLALLTGMRRGELVGLRWDDVDLPGWQLRVRTTRTVVGADTVEGPPKSRAGRRTVHLDWPTVRALHAVREHGESLTGRVFVDLLTGLPLHPAWVSRRFGELVDRAGLPRIRFHDLRHTSATLGLACGESLKAVSVRLGHADIAITGNLYAQVPDPLAARDARRLAAALDEQHDSGAGAA
jgi:integrase